MSAFDVVMVALKSIVADVLSRHEITVDDGKLHQIGIHLWLAGDPGAVRNEIRQWQADEHAARLDRVRKLDAVIAAYQERIDSMERADSLLEVSYMPRDHVRDVTQMMRNLKSVHETESAFIADRKHARVRRPTTAKIEYATQIYHTALGGLAFKRSQKCLVIADLLNAAGIDRRPREKVRDSLVEAIRNEEVRLK